MWAWPSNQVRTLSLATTSGKSAFHSPSRESSAGGLAAGAKLVSYTLVSISFNSRTAAKEASGIVEVAPGTFPRSLED